MYLYSGWPDSLVVLTAATLSLFLYLRDGCLLCFFIGHSMSFRSFPFFNSYSYLYSYFYPCLLLSDAQSKLLLLVPLWVLSACYSGGASLLVLTSSSSDILKTPRGGRQESSWRRPFRGPRDKYLHRLRCRGRETNMRLNQDFHRTTHLCAVSDSMYYIHCFSWYRYLNEIQRMSHDLWYISIDL